MMNRKIMGGQDYVTWLNLMRRLYHNADGIDVTFEQYYRPEDRAVSHVMVLKNADHIAWVRSVAP